MLDRAIAKFESEEEQERENIAWRLEEQHMLEELAFPIWETCRSAMEVECKKRPNHLTFEVQPNTDAVVRGAKSRKVLSVTYRPASKSIGFKCGGSGGHYSIRIEDDRQARFWNPNRDQFLSPEDVAEELLTLLFI